MERNPSIRFSYFSVLLAVLLTAIAAAAVGLLIFIPKIMNLL